MELHNVNIQKEYHTIPVTKHQYNTNPKDSLLNPDYIENLVQLKSHLAKHNYSNPKTLFLFIISSFNSLSKKNSSILYHMLSSLIAQLTLHQSPISYDIDSISQYVKGINTDYDRYLTLINKKFDNLCINTTFCYLASHSKHSIIVLLFSLMIGMTYITFDIDKAKTSKREAYHILKTIKQKNLCSEMEKVMCPVCSLNSIRLIDEYYLNFFLQSPQSKCKANVGDESSNSNSNKKKKMIGSIESNSNSKSTIGDEINGRMSHIVSLMESISNEIMSLEELIKNDKYDDEVIKEKLKAIGINT